MADALAHRLDFHRRLLQQPGEAVDVVLGQAVEMVGDDPARRLALVRIVDRVDLELQALRDAARADAAGVERLHPLERDQHLVGVDLVGHARRRRDLLERGAQVAVVVERFDDRAGEGVVARVERQDVDLGVQVLAQADVGGDQVERAQVALHALGADARRRLLPAVALVRRVADRGEQAVGIAGLQVDRDAVAGGGRVVVGRVLDFEKGVAAHRVVDLLREVERGQLQQANRMLQARRDGVLLFLGRSAERGNSWPGSRFKFALVGRAACRR